RPLALEQAPHFRRERARSPLASHDIERAILGGRHQPCRWVFRNTAESPDFDRAQEGFLNDILGQRKVVYAEDACERSDHAPRLAPEKMIADYHLIYDIDRADRVRRESTLALQSLL